MKESEFHTWLLHTLPPCEGLRVGPGDDAAVLPAAQETAVAVDLLVEGIHFEKGEPSAEEIGAKAVNRNFSDMAAMGLAPTWILVACAIPKGRSEDLARGIVRGIIQACQPWGVGIVGGDTSRSPDALMLSITVLGELNGLEPITRSGARPGDRLWVTGELGGSFLGKHLHFTPRIAEGLYLNRHCRPSAMLDLSDGLAIDLHRLLDASRVGVRLDGECIPISSAARERAKTSGKAPLAHALSDGEDFELLFTLSPEKSRQFEQTSQRDFQATCIGEVLSDSQERVLVRDHKTLTLERDGYDHRF